MGKDSLLAGPAEQEVDHQRGFAQEEGSMGFAQAERIQGRRDIGLEAVAPPLGLLAVDLVGVVGEELRRGSWTSWQRGLQTGFGQEEGRTGFVQGEGRIQDIALGVVALLVAVLRVAVLRAAVLPVVVLLVAVQLVVDPVGVVGFDTGRGYSRKGEGRSKGRLAAGALEMIREPEARLSRCWYSSDKMWEGDIGRVGHNQGRGIGAEPEGTHFVGVDPEVVEGGSLVEERVVGQEVAGRGHGVEVVEEGRHRSVEERVVGQEVVERGRGVEVVGEGRHRLVEERVAGQEVVERGHGIGAVEEGRRRLVEEGGAVGEVRGVGAVGERRGRPVEEAEAGPQGEEGEAATRSFVGLEEAAEERSRTAFRGGYFRPWGVEAAVAASYWTEEDGWWLRPPGGSETRNFFPLRES
jgi:hypothetical protein